jgi:hypothetical protein
MRGIASREAHRHVVDEAGIFWVLADRVEDDQAVRANEGGRLDGLWSRRGDSIDCAPAQGRQGGCNRV